MNFQTTTMMIAVASMITAAAVGAFGGSPIVFVVFAAISMVAVAVVLTEAHLTD